MKLSLATADYSFPKLEWEQTLRLARDIKMQAMDIGLFAGRSHLTPDEIFSNLLELAPGLTLTLDYTHFTYQGIPGFQCE